LIDTLIESSGKVRGKDAEYKDGRCRLVEGKGNLNCAYGSTKMSEKLGTTDVLEVHEHAKQRTLWESRKCIFICAIVTCSFFQFSISPIPKHGLMGIDLGTTFCNSFQAMVGFLQVFGYEDSSAAIGYSIDTVFQQLITSLLQLGLAFGGFCVGPFSMKFGRRYSFWIATLISIIAITIQIVVTVQWPVYIGRTLIGISPSSLPCFYFPS